MPNDLAPIHINFMLACYTSPDPKGVLGADHWDSGAGQETRQWLREQGLIDLNNRATERGAAWVDFICATPVPVSKWVLPEKA